MSDPILFRARLVLVYSTLFVFQCFQTIGREWFVAPQGNSNASGDRDHPVSILSVSRFTQPGDTVYLRQGVYILTESVLLEHSGNPDAWITYTTLPGEHAVIQAEKIDVPIRGHDHGAVHLEHVSYIRLQGLKIINSHKMGINIATGCHHVDILNCQIDNTFAPGIGVWNSKNIRILGCEVTRATNPGMYLHGIVEGEAPHESISIAGVDHFEVAFNHVHHGFKEGIDVKEVSANGRVHHNYVHDMPRQAYYADAWFGTLHHVVFDHNVAHDCEWGGAVSVEDKNSYLHHVAYHHNLFFNQRGSGIFFTLWGKNLLREKVLIQNNTLVNNGSLDHWSGPTGSIDLRSEAAQDVSIERNLCIGGGAYEIATFARPEITESTLEKMHIRVRGNWIEKTSEDIEGANWLYGHNWVYSGDSKLVGSDVFKSFETGDFRIRAELGAEDAMIGALPVADSFEGPIPYAEWVHTPQIEIGTGSESSLVANWSELTQSWLKIDPNQLMMLPANQQLLWDEQDVGIRAVFEGMKEDH